MYHPLSLFVGLRYTRSRRRNHFISFISLISTLGIALGVVVLITVLSVMNGFHKEVRERIEIFNQGGGFVFNAIHNMQANSPVENMLAMRQAILDSYRSRNE